MGPGEWLSILLLAGASPGGDARPTALASAEAGGASTAVAQAHPDDRREIVVIGTRLPGAALGDLAPEIQLAPEDVAGFGAGTIGELLDRLSPQTAGAGEAGAAPPLVLVNGQRISGFDEIRGLPPEAVRRIDILPEETALRYGLRPGSKVVNLVLRPDFRALAAEAGYGAATAGGRSSGEAKANVSRILPIGRWSLDAGYSRAGALLESERRIDDGAGRSRSLLPASGRLTLGGSFARDVVPNVAGSATVRFEDAGGRSLIGAASSLPGGPRPPPLRRETASRSGNAAFAVNGEAAGWNWTLNGGYGRGRQRVETEIDRSREPIRVVSRTTSADLQAMGYGSFASLPAGEATASLSARFDHFGYRNRSSGPLGTAHSALSRRTVAGQLSTDLPLLDSLSANFNAEFSRASDFGALRTLGYGLRWAPTRWLSVTLSSTDAEEAPDIESLGRPQLLTPNVRVYDFATGQTRDVTRIDGGNPELSAERRRSFRASLSLRPLRRANLSVTAAFVRSRSRDPVGSLPAALPAFEETFPERFERDEADRLVRLDARPLNFARAERDELRWGFTFLKSVRRHLPEASPTAGPLPSGVEEAREAGFDLARIRNSRRTADSLQLAVHHSWRIRDRLLLREGLPALDFLGGSSAGLRGGSARHQVEIQAAAYRGGFGVRIEGSWQSGSRVEDTPGRTLLHSDLARFDLRLFADLGERSGSMRRAAWLKNSRISIEVDNAFDARPRVRDAFGATPAGLQPVLLDPAGRSFRLTLRKLF